MKKNYKLLDIPNINSKDASFRKLIYKVENSLFKFDSQLKKDFDYLCICSGGTTSSCAKDGLTTLDLRKNYNKIDLISESSLVRIGGGVNMGNLLKHLEKYDQTFPIGLSKLPGAGYVLTGGISPLSRGHGLAIDHIESIKGFLGNGKFISLEKNKLNKKDKLIWEAIKGAAPFFSIITEIGLKTIPSFPIKIIEGFINEHELKEIIELAEGFPENVSLQWIYSEKIYIYIFAELKNKAEKEKTEKYFLHLKRFSTLKENNYKTFNQINFFPRELNLFELNPNNHSEVISLLGEDLKDNIPIFIEYLKEIIQKRPNNSCYVASQQLGGKTKKFNQGSSFFIHRESSWKPWIYASWEKNNIEEKEIVIDWLYESWDKLKRFYPNIHLAQLHNHLNSHQEEISLAFGNRLEELKTLKNIYDPQGVLPPL